MKKIFFISIFGLLSACSSAPDLEDILSKWVGHNINEVKTSWGKSYKKVASMSYGNAVKFYELTDIKAPDSTTYKTQNKNNKREYNTVNGKLYAYEKCEVTFILDEKDIITHWEKRCVTRTSIHKFK